MNKKVLAVIVLFIIGCSFTINMSLNNNVEEKKFSIIKSDIVANKISISYDEVSPYVDNYIIEIKDGERLVYKANTDKTDFEVELDNLINGREYALSVYADLGGDNTKKCDNDYHFVWNRPEFVQDTILLSDSDYTLNIDANLTKGDYRIKLLFGEEELLNEPIYSNEYVLEKKYYEGKVGIFKAVLMDNDVSIAEINLYNGVDPLTDVSIKSIANNQSISLANVLLEIAGGDNADYYNVKIYQDKTLIKEVNTREKVSLLSKNLFELSKNYRIELSAICGEYKRVTEVNFKIDDKNLISPVYLSNDWNNMKKGSKLTLSTATADAKILYTIDGSDPLTNGIEYKDPLTVNEDMTLKAIAISQNKKDMSILKTYDVNVRTREDLAVYISPSNQYRNIGVSEVGYTNEMDEMNDLSEYIIERLKEYNVKIYRNNPSEKIKDWVSESNEYQVDLHLAIHSNASDEHDEYGTETWIHTDSSNTLSLASAIQNSLTSIYPYKDRSGYDRGVRYAAGALGEVNEENLEFGILIEVAHHDDKSDAEWIMKNKKEIGYAIADSILRYYQVIE